MTRLQELYWQAQKESKCQYNVQFQDWTTSNEIVLCQVIGGSVLHIDLFNREGTKIVIYYTYTISHYAHTLLANPLELYMSQTIADSIDGFIIKETIVDERTENQKQEEKEE